MGNVFGTQARRKLGDAIQERVFQRSLPAPLSPEQLAVMDQLTQREQARMKDLPSLEQVNARDPSLDKLLDKLSNSITGRVIDITSSSQPSTSLSSQPGASSASSSPARPLMSKREKAEASEKAEALMNIGRLPSFILKEMFETRTASEAQSQGPGGAREGGGGTGTWADLSDFSSRVGGDQKVLRTLMEHCCLPQVGKVDTFGHQYAFARPPLWWRRGPISGGRYRSEPEDKRREEPWEKMIKK